MMRPRGEPTGKKWERWKKDAAKEAIAALRAYKRTGKYAVKESLYKRCSREISDQFNGKCAYCEALVVDAAVRKPDVEHHRPKGRVRDRMSGQDVRDAGGNEHPGYFWLAYHWQNLLPSCPACNRPGIDRKERSVGKWDYFPIALAHAAPPDDTVDIEEHYRALYESERPLLLNPWLIDDVAEHFTFDVETGIIGAVTEEAKATIELLDLNRDGLITQRLEQVDLALGALVRIFANRRAKNVTAEIEKEIDDGRTFSAFRRAAVLPIIEDLKAVNTH